MSTGRVLAVVFGILLGLLGLFLIVLGAATVLLDTQRDDDGYLSTPAFALTSDGYALATDQALLLEADPGSGRVPFIDRLDLRVQVERADGEVFLGIAPAEEIADYLEGVAHDEVARLEPGDGSRLTRNEGTATPGRPGDLDLWTVQAVGDAPVTLDWRPEAGRWAGVVMNADGSPGLDVTLRAGVQTSGLLPAGIALAITGLVLALAGGALAIAGFSRPTDAGGAATAIAAPVVGVGSTEPRPVASAYPSTLQATLDPEVSRWLWLVKWLLIIPHLVVLLVLWPVFLLLTVFAGLAILVTGRYPRAIFDINVGVLRWTWRVSYYSYGALGTDRYPPFTLGSAEGYPADLQVAYPERLSRGLVLVKWWLLALPHYLVVAVLVGGGLTWGTPGGTGDVWRLSLGGGLVGILVLVAAIVLLFTARYPPQLFDLVIGCQRWAYRVLAYAALMTDVYPPFRLDQGGQEPPVIVSPPPPAPAPAEAARPPEPAPH